MAFNNLILNAQQVMNKHHVIRSILSIAKKFSEENVSIYSLLKESGYFELYNQISEADIFEELAQHMEYIYHWLSLSENKRCNSGWYFNHIDKDKYIVGYLSPKENLETTEYSDKIRACAAFIKHEIENIRNS